MCKGTRGLPLLILIGSSLLVNSLKLNPVHPQAQRVDLVAEAKYLSVVYNAARDATDLSIITTPERALEALASESVSRLKLAVGRWAELEARLKPTGGDNPKLLDAVVNGAAAGRAFLGHLYALSNEFELSVHELEAACPLLWEHQLALKSVDPHVSCSSWSPVMTM